MTSTTLSKDTPDTPKASESALRDKIFAQINEERLFKDLGTVQLNRIKQIHEITENIAAAKEKDEYYTILEDHLKGISRLFSFLLYLRL